MKIFFTFLILPLFFFSNTYAQFASLSWQKTYGGSAFDQAQSIQKTFDGGFIAAGISTSVNGDVTGNHGFGDVWILKLDSTGNIIWQHSYGGSADDGAFAIKQTADSGYIIAATSTSVNGDVTVNHGGVDCWILKISSSGILQWEKSFGGTGTDIPYDILSTDDDGFIFAGYTNSTDGDVSFNHGFDDFWIVKLNSIGNLIWQKTYGGTDEEHAYNIIHSGDGGYLAAGYTKSQDGDITGNHGTYDYWVIKIDSTGILQWQHALGGSSEDRAHAIVQSADSGFIVAGFTASSDFDVTFNHGSEDLWLAKLDSSGALAWNHSYGGSGVDQAYTINSMPDGGFVVAGSSYSLDGDVTGNHGGYDFWVIRTDSTGALLWDISLGGTSVEEAYSINDAGNGKIIIAGGTLSTDGDITTNHGDFDYWITELEDPFSDFIRTVSSNDFVTFYPNPFSATTTLMLNPEKPGDAAITLYDAMGKKVKTFFAKGLSTGVNEIKIDAGDLQPGVYHAEVRMQEHINVSMLVVE